MVPITPTNRSNTLSATEDALNNLLDGWIGITTPSDSCNTIKARPQSSSAFIAPLIAPSRPKLIQNNSTAALRSLGPTTNLDQRLSTHQQPQTLVPILPLIMHATTLPSHQLCKLTERDILTSEDGDPFLAFGDLPSDADLSLHLLTSDMSVAPFNQNINTPVPTKLNSSKVIAHQGTPEKSTHDEEWRPSHSLKKPQRGSKRKLLWSEDEEEDWTKDRSPRSTTALTRLQRAREHHHHHHQYPSHEVSSFDAAVSSQRGATHPQPDTHLYKGVSRHRLTHRWEASLWLEGKQLYLGGFDTALAAAKAYDLAALACKGSAATINFSPEDYQAPLRELAGLSKEEIVAYVRRRSSAFARGRSKYRGVSGQNGRWEARIGSFKGRKNVSFGVFETEAEAAKQYDRALILEKGRSAKTNFPLTEYEIEVSNYEKHLVRVCRALDGSAVRYEAERYTLPIGRVVTAEERKRSAVIHAVDLRRALQDVATR